MTAPAAPKSSWLRRTLGGIYRWCRHVPERLYHPVRRQRAQELLRQSPAPAQVLFLCLGNVCRSPYAEVAARRDAALWPTPTPRFLSAGLIGPDRAAPDMAQLVAADRKAPLDHHRSQLVTREMVESSDLIVVMETRHAEQIRERFGRSRQVVLLGDLDPWSITTRGIPDPWNKPRESFEASYERIDRCLLAMVLHLRRAASAEPSR